VIRVKGVAGSSLLLTHLWRRWPITADRPSDLTSFFQLIAISEPDLILLSPSNIWPPHEDALKVLDRCSPFPYLPPAPAPDQLSAARRQAETSGSGTIRQVQES